MKTRDISLTALQKEYSSDKVSCKSSDGPLPSKRSIVQEGPGPSYAEAGSISFISASAGAGSQRELVPCLKTSKARGGATLPRHASRDCRWVSTAGHSTQLWRSTALTSCYPSVATDNP